MCEEMISCPEEDGSSSQPVGAVWSICSQWGLQVEATEDVADQDGVMARGPGVEGGALDGKRVRCVAQW